MVPFKGGSGIFQKCLERYIENITQRLREKGKTFEVNCSYISLEEEKLFNDVLFDLLFEPDYLYRTELYVILEEFSKLAKMTYQEARFILYGLTMINIEVSGADEGPWIVSSIFPGCTTGNCLNIDTWNYDSEDQYFALEINPEFLNVCSEIKAEQGR